MASPGAGSWCVVRLCCRASPGRPRSSGGRGYARLHRAGCGTITIRPPFTGAYIKVCSASLAELDRWALRRAGERTASALVELRSVPAAARTGAQAPGVSDVPRRTSTPIIPQFCGGGLRAGQPEHLMPRVEKVADYR